MYWQLARVFITILLFVFSPYLDGFSSTEDKPREDIIMPQVSESEQLYAELSLDGVIEFNLFEKAYNGYKKLNAKNKDILTIIDFNQPSSKKRLFVLDLLNKKLLFQSYVSHGRNSGSLYAKTFSNKNGSHQSSLGFYETEGAYNGSNGYSLILNGLEKGINDQAKARAIVMHGADYCSKQVIESSGRLGRSFGCPSIPRELTMPIINTIKNGSLLFIYADNETYLAKSKILPREELAHSLKSL